MFKGSIYVTTDLNVAIQSSASCKVIIIGEPNNVIQYIPNAIVGTIFVPPYQAMMAYLDGNTQSFIEQYFMHLNSNEVMDFTSSVLMAIRNGLNIMLYLNMDEACMYFGHLSQFMNSTFGITIGSDNVQFSYIDLPQYNDSILSLLYLKDLITSKEFFMEFNPTMTFSDIVVMKLCEEFQPHLEKGNSLEPYRGYFYNRLLKIHQRNMYIENPIVRVKKC